MSEAFIPMADPRAGFLAHQAEITRAIEHVLNSGRYILGAEVSAFEEAFAGFIGSRHCVGVNSGTDALVLALRGLGIGPGDEVITVSHTAVATVAAIELVGAIPVLVDVSEATRCMQPGDLGKALSERTRAVIPVHLYGQPAPMAEMVEFAKAHQLYTIEDCAQAHGAMIDGKKVGSFGDVACFSFYPTKNLGAIGDGGAVVCNDAGLYDKLRWLREYGWKNRYISDIAGMNTRLDEIQAAILNVKLKYLEEENEKRIALAGLYADTLAGTALSLPRQFGGQRHVFHLYVIETEARDALQVHLLQSGIGSGIHYPQAVHQQPAYRGRIRTSGKLEVTEKLVKRILSLPMYPQLEEEAILRVCQVLHGWEGR